MCALNVQERDAETGWDFHMFCFCVVAGRWCLCPGWHSDFVIMHHQWEHTFLCARSSSKVPIRPVGRFVDMLALTLASQLWPTLRSTTGGA